MKYFYDTEFIEGTQNQLFGRKSLPTIDLISIGIVSEDNREYYAISKDFNLKDAWNRYDLKIETASGDQRNIFPNGITHKVYWIRENVLRPIFRELRAREVVESNDNLSRPFDKRVDYPTYEFDYKSFDRLIKKYGKSNKQIADEIKLFTHTATLDQLEYKGIKDKMHIYQFKYTDIKWEVSDHYSKEGSLKEIINQTDAENPENVELYGYYSAYDHVVLCWLFGKMIDLPKGFPMYTFDLQQESDRKFNLYKERYYETICFGKSFIHDITETPGYPKSSNVHNALDDAKWTKQFHYFLENLSV